MLACSVPVLRLLVKYWPDGTIFFTMEWRVKAVEELKVVAKEVLSRLGERQDGSGAAVLALHGDLGAGKTTFMQTLAAELGVTEPVTSPTFVIMKTYELIDKPFTDIVHIDAYRIEEIDEMRPLGFTQILAEKGFIVCIEWAENISELLPPQTLHLTFTIEGDERKIELK